MAMGRAPATEQSVSTVKGRPPTFEALTFHWRDRGPEPAGESPLMVWANADTLPQTRAKAAAGSRPDSAIATGASYFRRPRPYANT